MYLHFQLKFDAGHSMATRTPTKMPSEALSCIYIIQIANGA